MYSTLETLVVESTQTETEFTEDIEVTEEVTIITRRHTASKHEKFHKIESGTTTMNLLDIPNLSEGYTIVGTENYMKEKKRRPLSLSSIHDLRIVKEGKSQETNNNKKDSDAVRKSSHNSNSSNNHDDRKQRIRTLMLASAALARFKYHASAKRKEKKQSNGLAVSPRLSNQTTINDKKRLSLMEMDELFNSVVCRRYVSRVWIRGMKLDPNSLLTIFFINIRFLGLFAISLSEHLSLTMFIVVCVMLINQKQLIILRGLFVK